MRIHVPRGQTVWGLAMALLLVAPLLALGGAPRLLPFQAHLMDEEGRFVEDGVYHLYFDLADHPEAETALWEGEAHTASVRDGMVNVLLGTQNPIPAGMSFEGPLYLRVRIPREGGGGPIIDALPPQVLSFPIFPVFFAQDSGMMGGRRWDDFLLEPSGGRPDQAPETSRAKDADRFVGIAEERLLAASDEPTSPKVQRAWLADAIAADLDLEGSMEVLGDVATSGGLTLKDGVWLQLETENSQFLHAASNAVGMGLQSGPLVFRSGRHFAWYRSGFQSDRPVLPGDPGLLDMMLTDGALGVGVRSPRAWLDVWGRNTGTDSMGLRGGRGADPEDPASQILFGFDGTANYAHALFTGHGPEENHNRLVFQLWGTFPRNGTLGPTPPLVLRPTGVGIGGDNGGHGLNVHGDVIINSEAPLFLFKKYSLGTDNLLVTDMEARDYTPAIVGSKFLDGDIDEYGVKSTIMQMDMMIFRRHPSHPVFDPIIPPSEYGWWTVLMSFATHNVSEKKEVTIMFVHNSLVHDQAYAFFP